MTALSFFPSHRMVFFSPLDQFASGKFASFYPQSHHALSVPEAQAHVNLESLSAMGVSPYLRLAV